jgi:hypothetical protein
MGGHIHFSPEVLISITVGILLFNSFVLVGLFWAGMRYVAKAHNRVYNLQEERITGLVTSRDGWKSLGSKSMELNTILATKIPDLDRELREKFLELRRLELGITSFRKPLDKDAAIAQVLAAEEIILEQKKGASEGGK